MTSLSAEDLASAIPDVESALTLPGPNDRITIIRDALGIPHIRAESAADAFFGQGFATAQDRLWHMDLDRARAYGRWAELAGAADADSVVLVMSNRPGADLCERIRRAWDAAGSGA